MGEQQKETAFLRQFIAYDDTAERHQLEERLAQAERDVRCARRAALVMALLVALAAVGLGYSAVLVADFPINLEQFFTFFFVRVSCALGLASLICLACFLAVQSVYRRGLRQRRVECLRLATKALEARLGSPRPLALPQEEAALR